MAFSDNIYYITVYPTQLFRSRLLKGISSKNVITSFSASDSDVNYEIEELYTNTPDISGESDSCTAFLSKNKTHIATVRSFDPEAIVNAEEAEYREVY